jgi:hypothetical protein
MTEDNGNVVLGHNRTTNSFVGGGWTRKSVSPGDGVRFYVYAAKNGESVGNVYKVALADGRELTTAGPTASSARKNSTPGKRKNAP